MTHRSITLLYSICILFFLFTCNQKREGNKIVEGDLYYSWLHIGSFHNEPDSIIEKVKLYADTVNRKLVDSDNLKLLAMYDILKKEDLLSKPFIDLRLDTDSIIKIYFTTDDYDKIKIYKRQDLVDTKKKIRIKVQVRDLGFGMALSIKLLSVIKIDGRTQPQDNKWKIEDYQ